MSLINPVTIGLVLIFIIPVILSALRPFTKERIFYSIETLYDYLELIFGLVISIYIIKMIYFEHSQEIFKRIYEFIPENIKNIFAGRDILVYLLNVPIVLLIFVCILRPLKVLIFRTFIEPLSEKMHIRLGSLSNPVKFVLGGLVQLPRSVFIVFITALLLNFYSYYFSIPQLSRWMNDSKVYSLLYKEALSPILNSNIAKTIPVLLNDSFRKDNQNGLTGNETNGNSILDRIASNLAGNNIRVIEYFNGVTLDEAVKSSSEIDSTARNIVGDEKNDYRKAYLIYKWISKNVKYDTDKAEKVSANPKGISSGSIVAFETRKGICFDYSCLYISMCRAVGLKVRLVTGLGYSGVSWGDHAWNQVYSVSKEKWVNVDTTFGTIANYFDKANFNVDHKFSEIQGEW